MRTFALMAVSAVYAAAAELQENSDQVVDDIA
jgi:hypothetical protein